MNQIFDIETWRQVLVNTLAQLGASMARFLPNLVATIALLAVGWIVAKVAEVVVRGVLAKIGLDRASARTRVAETLRRAGVEAAPSRIVARVLFWTLMLTFILSAVGRLGFTSVTATTERLIGFFPDVVAAGLIVILGLVLGRLVRNVVSSAAAAANVPRARRIGAASGGLVVLLVMVLALEQLGIETALLVTVLSVLVAAASLTLGLSFALGARPVVTHILAGHFLRQSLPPGSNVEIQGRKGSVERVGPLETLLGDSESSWSIPNATLMNETVLRQQREPPGKASARPEMPRP